MQATRTGLRRWIPACILVLLGTAAFWHWDVARAGWARVVSSSRASQPEGLGVSECQHGLSVHAAYTIDVKERLILVLTNWQGVLNLLPPDETVKHPPPRKDAAAAEAAETGEEGPRQVASIRAALGGRADLLARSHATYGEGVWQLEMPPAASDPAYNDTLNIAASEEQGCLRYQVDVALPDSLAELEIYVTGGGGQIVTEDYLLRSSIELRRLAIYNQAPDGTDAPRHMRPMVLLPSSMPSHAVETVDMRSLAGSLVRGQVAVAGFAGLATEKGAEVHMRWGIMDSTHMAVYGGGQAATAADTYTIDRRHGVLDATFTNTLNTTMHFINVRGECRYGEGVESAPHLACDPVGPGEDRVMMMTSG